MQLEQGTWVVVADGEKYLLLRNIGDEKFMNLEVVDHERSRHPPAHEMATDRPGRQQDATRQMPAGGGVEAWGRSAMEETDWHRVGEARFAEHVAEILGEREAAGAFERILVVADARTLGVLRQSLGDAVRARVVAEMTRDLTNLPLARIEASIKAYDA